MKIISHRGNLHGPISDQENNPKYIDLAIAAGFYVEIDVRVFDNDFYLGHDKPDYKIDYLWLLDRKEFLLCHCKNLSANNKFSNQNEINYFSHYNDPYVLISDGKIWVHDLSLELNENCIIPLIDKKSIDNYLFKDKIYGVCTDYPYLIK